MGTGKIKVLGVSLVAITLVFVVFLQGMVRMQLTKIQIEDQLKQSLHLEALQLEVAYKNIYSVTNHLIDNKYEELDEHNEAIVESVMGLISGHQELRSDSNEQVLKDIVLQITMQMNKDEEHQLWIIDKNFKPLSGPTHLLGKKNVNHFPAFKAVLNESNIEPFHFEGYFEGLTGMSEKVCGFVKYDPVWKLHIVSFHSAKSVEEEENKVRDLSNKRMESEIAQMSIHGTAAILDENMTLKHYSVPDMRGETLNINESQTNESISELLINNKNTIVEYALLDPVTLKDRTRLAYVNYNPDDKMYYIITHNREDLFSNINVQSTHMLRVMGLTTLILLIVNGYLILRNMRMERFKNIK